MTDPADDKPSIVIRFDNVHKSFGTQAVLAGLSFDVERGKTLGIMGPSGTGKSVMLRHIIGLMACDRGRVEVEGHDMARVDRKTLARLRRNMGYVFQEGALINWLNVGDNIALPLRETTRLSEKEICERVEAKLELVHIPGTWNKMPSEISGGMKKRVGLARALITEPDIILYDEPNAGLDPEIARAINETIREVGQRLETTAIVVEHRIPCIRAVADEVIFLNEGKVGLRAATEDFFTSQNPRLVRFLGDQQD